MKQYEAVIEVMKNNGGFATLGHLYSETLKVPNIKWKTKTPFASIRRIVQDERFFFKIKPGLWALKEMESKLPFLDHIKGTKKIKKEFDHSYYQGLLVELGNLRGFQTTVPNQDKNKYYLEKKLSNMVTVNTFYQFTYENIIQRARTIDVVWFNIRRFPNSVFEVEHSTDIQNSLLKFLELQDFNSSFKIVAPQSRKAEFEKKVSYEAFRPIKERVGFLSYQTVSDLHTKEHELLLIEKHW
jgi:hypothetical protein